MENVLNGAHMRRVRELRGMTATELAAAVGCSAQAIGRFETGSKDPSLKTLCAIAAALGVTVSELIF